MNGSAEYVTLSTGLIMPIAAVQLALQLEARGLELGRDSDVLVVGPRDRLTDADRLAIRRWKLHLLAIIDIASSALVH